MKRLFSLGMVGLLLAFAPVRADDIPLHELPEAVTRAIDDRFPGARYLSAERETDDGVTTYEVDIEHEGRRYEVEVSPEGQIIEIDD